MIDPIRVGMEVLYLASTAATGMKSRAIFSSEKIVKNLMHRHV